MKISKTLLVMLVAGMISGVSAVAQQNPPTFPSFSADNPQRIGIISRLKPERRAALGNFLDKADGVGFFPPNVEARGKDEFGILLYVLSSWAEAKELPPKILPTAAANQLQKINPAFYRYSIPVRRGADDSFVLMFYIATESNDPTLRCIAQDLVVTLENKFDPSAMADCVRKTG